MRKQRSKQFTEHTHARTRTRRRREKKHNVILLLHTQNINKTKQTLSRHQIIATKNKVVPDTHDSVRSPLLHRDDARDFVGELPPDPQAQSWRPSL
jgi:hypothetical protein